MSGPSNLNIEGFYELQKRRSTDYEGLKLRNVLSGRESCVVSLLNPRISDTFLLSTFDTIIIKVPRALAAFDRYHKTSEWPGRFICLGFV